jgi:hypothetical protein
MKLGRLTRIEVRSIWPHEASDFTPWLALRDNIAMLADALRIGELQVEATEREVGRFSADIVARSDSAELVLIENQLEQTDHRHLGQVLTYLAGLEEDATVVWIATRFLEEHRAAIDWLNENTNERFSFFGVELDVVRIGDSDPAPVFHLAAKPNDWSRGVRSVARQVSEGAITERQQLLLRYWTAFADTLSRASPPVRAPKPNHDHWKTFGVGRSGFSINITSLVQNKRIGAEIYISRPTAKADFQALFAQRHELEKRVGEPLKWEELPERKGSRILVEPLQADPANEADWPRQHAWAHEKLVHFREAFTRPIQTLADTSVAQIDYPSGEDEDPRSQIVSTVQSRGVLQVVSMTRTREIAILALLVAGAVMLLANGGGPPPALSALRGPETPTYPQTAQALKAVEDEHAGCADITIGEPEPTTVPNVASAILSRTGSNRAKADALAAGQGRKQIAHTQSLGAATSSSSRSRRAAVGRRACSAKAIDLGAPLEPPAARRHLRDDTPPNKRPSRR